MGCKIEFDSQVTDFVNQGRKNCCGLSLMKKKRLKLIILFLAIGQSADDTYLQTF